MNNWKLAATWVEPGRALQVGDVLYSDNENRLAINDAEGNRLWIWDTRGQEVHIQCQNGAAIIDIVGRNPYLPAPILPSVPILESTIHPHGRRLNTAYRIKSFQKSSDAEQEAA